MRLSFGFYGLRCRLARIRKGAAVEAQCKPWLSLAFPIAGLHSTSATFFRELGGEVQPVRHTAGHCDEMARDHLLLLWPAAGDSALERKRLTALPRADGLTFLSISTATATMTTTTTTLTTTAAAAVAAAEGTMEQLKLVQLGSYPAPDSFSEQ